MTDDTGYELDDPKHPTWADRMVDSVDAARKREKEEGGPDAETPTTMHWQIEHGKYLVGWERPTKLEHADRLAGKMILDRGEWREVRVVALELPADVGKALTLTYGDVTFTERLLEYENERLRLQTRIEELEKKQLPDGYVAVHVDEAPAYLRP